MHKRQKDLSLEALRGLAALSVVAWHCVVAFVPGRSGLFPGMSDGDAFRGRIWFGLIHGDAAVAFFFVLSGFVLTRAALERRDGHILLRGTVKRWPRLVPPVLIAVVLSWALFEVGLYGFVEAAAVTGSPWLGRFAGGIDGPFVPDLADALRQGLFGTFVHGAYSYDSSLWTMRYELFGSYLAFGLAAAALWLPGRRSRVSLCCGAAVLAFAAGRHWYAAFPMGVALAAALPSKRANWPIALSVTLLAVWLYLAGFSGPAEGAFRLLGSVWPEAVPALYANLAGAVLLIVAAETSATLRRALAWKALATLGRWSFPLYLLHVPALCSAGCAVLLWLLPRLPAPWPALGAVAATLLVSLLGAALLSKVDRCWVALLDAAVTSVGQRLRHRGPAAPTASDGAGAPVAE